MLHRRTAFALLLAALAAAGCSTTAVGLSYGTAARPATPLAGRSVTVGTFVDQRGEPATWLGAIRGGFGNPLKTLESSQPVAALVQTAFADALKARGAAVPGGSLQLTGTIRKLFCNQVMQREANVEIEVSIRAQGGSGAPLFSRTYAATNYESAGLAAGAFGSVDELRALTERTLREVIDKALDDSALQAALR